MKKVKLIFGRELSLLMRSKVIFLLIIMILGFLYGLFSETKQYAEHVTRPDLVLEYQRAVITGAIFISVILPVGVGRIMIGIIGASLLAKEFEANTMSTLGTLPIKRESILLGKFLAISFVSLIVALFFGLEVWAICFLTLGLPPFGIVVLTIFLFFWLVFSLLQFLFLETVWQRFSQH